MEKQKDNYYTMLKKTYSWLFEILISGCQKNEKSQISDSNYL